MVWLVCFGSFRSPRSQNAHLSHHVGFQHGCAPLDDGVSDPIEVNVMGSFVAGYWGMRSTKSFCELEVECI